MDLPGCQGRTANHLYLNEILSYLKGSMCRLSMFSLPIFHSSYKNISNSCAIDNCNSTITVICIVPEPKYFN